jgi:hypothetical protein
MKTKRMVRFATSTCLAIHACLWLGCQRDGGAASDAPIVARAASASTNTAGWEYKTVEEAMSESELRQQMGQWQREGWAVLSISKPLPQPDGTVHRKVELKRTRQ